MFEKYPNFKARGAKALREILDWPDNEPDRIVMSGAEDGSGVGAALIAALTLERVKQGNLVGIRNKDAIKKMCG